jgi:hypothetical protein
MADRIQSYKVISAGGLNSNENHLDLAENAPGSATRLVNYEVSLYGGYRRINGYEPFDDLHRTVGDETQAEGKVLCIALFKDDLYDRTIAIAARKDLGANSYSVYRHIPYVGWEKVVTGNTRVMVDNFLNVDLIRHVSFNFGDGNKMCFVDGVNAPIIYDGTNWVELTVSATGTTEDAGGDQLLAKPSLVDVFENHLFFGGAKANQAIICHSAPENPYNFTAAAGGGQLPVGFDVVQFKPFRDNLFIFGGNAIKKVTADLTAGFVLDQVTTNVGCIAANSVLEIGGDLVFLAPDGIRPVAGTSRIGDVELETISKSIQSLLVDLPVDYDLDALLTGVVIRTKSQLRYFVGDDGKLPQDSVGIIGGLRTSDQKLGWEFGELLGIRASCATSGYIGRTEYVLHGDYDGVVYRQEAGNSFDGREVVGIYSTPYFDFGDTEVRKILRKLNTYIRAEGPMEINIAVAYDWDDTKTAKPPAYSQESKGAPVIYNGRNITYNGFNVTYGGAEKPIMTTDIQGSGYSVKVTYVTLGVNSPHSIQGMVFEFSVAGRR